MRARSARRSGLSADPGGFPLYKGGTPVGGVGVLADGIYTLDHEHQRQGHGRRRSDRARRHVRPRGAGRPARRSHHRRRQDAALQRLRSSRICSATANRRRRSLRSTARPAPLQMVPGYFGGTVARTAPVRPAASGIRPDALDYPGLDAFVLVDAANAERFRPRAGTEASGALTATEVREILSQRAAHGESRARRRSGGRSARRRASRSRWSTRTA